MNRTLIVGVCALLAGSAQAQLFGPESLTGAALGGLAGGVIGHNQGRQTAEGAAIGAGAGLVLGALVGHERRRQESYAVAAPAPVYYASAPTYYAPAPTYYRAAPSRPNYAFTGAALGGVAGGVIGHNQGRRTAEGVAIGAGAGLLLGAWAEQDARRTEAVYVPPPRVVGSAAPGTTALAPAPVPPASPAAPELGARPSAMSGANALFGR